MTATATTLVPPLLQLELTGMCNLSCRHCYASSSPQGTHGSMTADNWESVICQAAEIGVKTVQLIGGEPTLYPGLPRLIRHADGHGLKVTVFSNLVRVTPELWKLFELPAVSLATSWYTADPDTHAAITGSRPAYTTTRASIAKAARLGIPLRVEIIAVQPGQDTAAAEAEVRALGVTHVTVRPVQELGRAATAGNPSDPAELCGRCGTTIAAVLPDGQVTPCGIGRWLESGNVRDTPLADIFAAQPWQQALAAIPRQVRDCGPDCPPSGDGSDCPPASEIPCAPESNAARSLPLVTVG